eukprot:TRINITY_DN17954_c1_g1_i1.p1 TRINITY_DN17954_c1_g1~~TRINITY_DN17954_c1_g1_i1.p1  ORF type:complete len:317 (+),score=79.01 TRINITY_DN17954_c1_g1_i1:34-951(+)
MDLGAFTEEVSDAVAGICGDSVVVSHTQASHVLDALCRKPGANSREIAAVFGVTLEQFQRCRSGGSERTKDPIYADLCRTDAIYTWNVLIQRINYAAHWREEYREMCNSGENESDSEDDAIEDLPSNTEETAVEAAEKTRDSPDAQMPGGDDGAVVVAEEKPLVIASKATREKVLELFSKELDGAPSEAVRRRLTRRLEEEAFEQWPDEKEFRHRCRSIVANLRRNTMLAGGFAAGRIPPQWILLADHEALAPRMQQLQRRVMRYECKQETQHTPESAAVHRKMWKAARGEDLQPPAQAEDPSNM